MIVIAGATILMNLAKIESLDILRELFKEISIAPSVYDEIVKKGHGKYGSHEVEQARWIKIEKVKDEEKVQLLLSELDLGESESIVLALEQKADLVLVDEIKARHKLKILGFNVKGTLGILVEAQRQNLIGNVQEKLDILIERGTWIGDDLYRKVLAIISHK